LAIAELARKEVEKRKLVETLGKIGGRQGEYSKVDYGDQLNAIKALLSYGYGPPRAEMESSSDVVIQVTYVERNQIAATGASPSANESDSGMRAVQCDLLRTPLGQDGSGDESSDSDGAEG
jgi:hypothetical protein